MTGHDPVKSFAYVSGLIHKERQEVADVLRMSISANKNASPWLKPRRTMNENVLTFVIWISHDIRMINEKNFHTLQTFPLAGYKIV